MPRPSSTAFSIEAKLSSVKTISAAPLATSVPVMPIAIPISAAFKLGASLTPSPVIAAIKPLSLIAFTMDILFSGETRANTLTVFTTSFNCSNDNLSSSSPLMACDSSSAIPNSLAMAKAVVLWSPVIMIVVMPAFLKILTAFLHSGRGGSIIPTSPKKIKSLSSNVSLSLYANAKTRRASLAMLSEAAINSCLSSSVMSLTSPLISILVVTLRTLSIAPLVYTMDLSPHSWRVDIIFLTESNGYSSTRGVSFSKSPFL